MTNEKENKGKTFPALVIDASAILALMLSEAEGPDVEKPVEELLENNGQLIVPPLFFYEVMNGLLSALLRNRISEEDIPDIEAGIGQLPFSPDPSPSAFVRQRIREYAIKHALTCYDAAYIEIALRYDLPLKTKDRHLLSLRETYPIIF